MPCTCKSRERYFSDSDSILIDLAPSHHPSHVRRARSESPCRSLGEHHERPDKNMKVETPEQEKPLVGPIVVTSHESVIAEDPSLSNPGEMIKSDREDLLRKSIGRYQRALKGNSGHKETKDTLSWLGELGYLFEEDGRRAEGIELYYKPAVEMGRRVWGIEDPDVRGVIFRMACACLRARWYAKAEECYVEVIEVGKRTGMAEDNVVMFEYKWGLGVCYFNQERWLKAITLLEPTLSLPRIAKSIETQTITDKEAKGVIYAIETLCRSYGKVGRLEEAGKLGETILALHEKYHGPDGPETCKWLGRLAKINSAMALTRSA
jgi:tetratricopeptide (TPR) repeat protein